MISVFNIVEHADSNGGGFSFESKPQGCASCSARSSRAMIGTRVWAARGRETLEPVFSEHLALELLEALRELVVFLCRYRLFPRGEDERVLDGGVMLVHQHQAIVCLQVENTDRASGVPPANRCLDVLTVPIHYRVPYRNFDHESRARQRCRSPCGISEARPDFVRRSNRAPRVFQARTRGETTMGGR